MDESPEHFNPFPGLRPFTEDEDYLFFGREVQSTELLRRLRQTRFLAVVGTSGSGKSSLVLAGVLPALHGGVMTQAGSRWRVALLRPGNNPIGALAHALSQPHVLGTTGNEDDVQAIPQTVMLETTLRRSALGLVEVAQQARRPAGENLLVVVDQFEELFRFKATAPGGQSSDDAAALVKLLLEASRAPTPPIYIVLTMRSDFLGDCAQFRDLPEAINDGQFLIPRMTRDQRRQAIEGPVAVGGATMTPRLVQRLLNDVGDNPDQLPILQHALMRTWENWRANGAPALDLPHYDAIGGMAEALSQHADEVFAALPDDRSRTVAEKLFRALTDTGTDHRGLRRPTRLEELCAVTSATETEVRTVIETFRQPGSSFLVPPVGTPLSGDSVVDISHESLMRVWGQLKTWAEEEAQSARMYRRLAETAGLHAAGKAGLWRDPDLHMALDWRDKEQPNAAWAQRYHPDFHAAMQFLEESWNTRTEEARREEERRRRDLRRTQLTAIVLGAALLITVGFAGYGYQQRKKAEQQSQLALARQLESQARLAVSENTGDSTALGALLAIESVQTADTQEGTRFLDELTGLLSPLSLQSWQAHSAPVVAMTFTADGRWLATASKEGDVVVRETSTGKEVVRLEQAVFSYHHVISFSPDGRFLVTSQGSQVGVWDTARWPEGGRDPMQQLQTNGEVMSVAFSPDGRLLATALHTGAPAVTVYDTTTIPWQEVAAVNDDDVRAVAFSADGSWLVTNGRSAGGFVTKVWGKTASPLQYQPVAEVNSESTWVLALSADGGSLATSRSNGVMQIWKVTRSNDGTVRVVEAKQPEDPPTLHRSEILAASFSPTSASLLATVSGDGGRLWKTGPPTKEVSRVIQHANTVAFSPDGLWLATGNEQGTISVWPIREGQESLRIPHGDQIQSATFSSDNRWLATASADGRTRIFEVGTWRELVRIKGDGQALGAVFSPNSRWLLTQDQNVTPVRVFDTATWREVKRLVQAGGFSAGFSPDGRWFVTKSANIVRLFDTSTWHEQHMFDHKYTVDRVSFSPNGRRLVTWPVVYSRRHESASPSRPWQEYEPRVWDIDSQHEVTRLAEDQAHNSSKAEQEPSLDQTQKAAKEPSVDPAAMKAWPTVEEWGLGHKPSQQPQSSPDKRWLAHVVEHQVRLWPLSAHALITEACARLSRNLTSREWAQYLPGKQPLRATCSFDLPVPYRMLQGRDLARIGHVEEAVVSFRQALKADPGLSFDPETEARRSVAAARAERLFQQSQKLLQKEETKQEAIAVYQKAMAADHAAAAPAGVLPLFDPIPSVSGNFFTAICWNGSVRGYATDVMEACERAVNLNPQNGSQRDSRGLAKALTGDVNGAIEDFQIYIAQTTDEARKAQRQGWVTALREGKNPFTPEELEKLRTQ